MTRVQFERALRHRLSGVPENDVERTLEYYREMLDERMEGGMAEDAAVAAVGPLDEIVAEVLTATPMPKLIRKKVTPTRRLRPWEVILLVLGSPLWLAIAAAVFAVVCSVYVVLWVCVASVFLVAAALLAAALALPVFGVLSAVGGNPLACVFWVGGGVACAGLAVLCFFAGRAAVRAAVWIGKKIWLGIKRLIVGKERNQ